MAHEEQNNPALSAGINAAYCGGRPAGIILRHNDADCASSSEGLRALHAWGFLIFK